MSNYKSLSVNSFYQPYNAPVTSGTAVSGYDFQSNTERNAITDGQVRTMSADKITAGTIDSAVIYGGSITGNQLSGGTLVLGGTLNGSGLTQIKNSAGTTIIQGNNEGHSYYTTAGVRQVQINETGLIAYTADGTTRQFQLSSGGFYGYGTTSAIIRLRENSASTVNYGAIGYGTGSGLGMYITTPSVMYQGASGNFWNVAAGTISALWCENASGSAAVYSEGNVVIAAPNSGKDVSIIAGDDVVITCGDEFRINGTPKTAIVPTKSGHKALYAMEAPNVWFMDFVDKKDVLDPLFIEVTTPPYKYIKCDDGTYQVWAKRKGFEDTRFEDKTPEQFTANNSLYSGKLRKDVQKDIEGLKKLFEGK